MQGVHRFAPAAKSVAQTQSACGYSLSCESTTLEGVSVCLVAWFESHPLAG